MHLDYKNCMARLMPLVFVLKRIVFAVGAWFLKIELIALFVAISLLNMCLILHAKPYLETS